MQRSEIGPVRCGTEFDLLSPNMKLPSPLHLMKCSVYIKMHPRPRSMTESREVLRALEQFGPVASYWHLKVRTTSIPISANSPPSHASMPPLRKTCPLNKCHPQYDAHPAYNSALATYTTPAAAQAALAAQVLKIPARPSPLDALSASDPDSFAPPAPPPPPAAAAASSEPPASYSGMQIVVRPAQANPASRASRSHYAWPYRVEPTNLPGAALLGGAAIAEDADAGGAGGAGTPSGRRGVEDLKFEAPEIAMRVRLKRESQCDAERRTRGWGRLGELWALGEAERKADKRRERSEEGQG